MTETKEVCRFINQLDYDSIPSDLIDRMKGCTLDLLGVAIYGFTKKWSRLVAERGKKYQSTPACTVIGFDWKASPEIASLVNGTMSHAFELDDVHELIHPGAVIIPSALAVGEAGGSTGKELLTGIVTGYEVMCRVGLVMGTPHMLRGFHSTGTTGTFGSATAAGKLMNQPRDRLVHTLGLAGSFSAGLMEFSQTGGMVKRLHAGRAAEGGVMAAYLAQDGFTGPTTVFEGKYGFCKTFSDEPELHLLTDGLGTDFVIDEMTIKPYACCSDVHPTIDAILTIKQEHNLDPKRIERILVETTTKGVEQNAVHDIDSTMAAQYSVPFSVAAALLYEIRDPRTYREEVFKNQDIQDLISKVDMLSREEFDQIYPKRIASSVVVYMEDKKEYRITIDAATGSPQNPMTRQEIEDKFMRLTNGIIPLKNSKKIIDLVSNLEGLTDVAELTRSLSN